MNMMKKELMEAAKDINNMYKEGEQPIKINTKSTNDQLIRDISKATEELEDGDELNQLTVDILLELEIDIPAKLKIRKEKSQVKAKDDKREDLKPGVITSIQEIVLKTKETKKSIMIEEILSFLEKRFPERDPKSMIKTIKVQLPNRMNKERDMKIEKIDNGFICK